MIESVGENDAARFRKGLETFPHTFQLPGIGLLQKATLKRLKFGLESALKVGYKTDLENARARNLLAYLLHRLDRPVEAQDEVDKALALDGQHNNLVSLANKAVFLCEDLHWSAARDCAKRLHRVREECSDDDFKCLVIKAKAELAFTCTKLGPKFSPEAFERFSKIIPEASEPEVWLWKFGLALTRRRALRGDPRTISPVTIEETEVEQLDVLRSFLEIAKKCDSLNLRAKAYAEIAILLNGVWKNPTLKDKLCNEAEMGRVKACNEAIKLDGEDNSVLCKCAVIYRICRMTKESLTYMTKSVQIRPTSTAHHHLGIIYKAKATVEKTKDKPKVKGFYQQYSSGGTAEHSQEEMVQGVEQISLSDSLHQSSLVPSADDRHRDDPPQLSLDRNIRKMQRVVKSPPKGVTSFTRDDEFVEEALHNFKEAIKISQGENTRAVYDLALLYKALGENESALKSFRAMLKTRDCVRETESVNVYEQMGLVLKELADSEEDEVKQKALIGDSESSLLMALTFASRIFHRSPFIGEVWQSFSSLLQQTRESERDEKTKLKEKVRLHRLIGDHTESLHLLKTLVDIDPTSVDDPEYQHLFIKSSVDAERYEDACTYQEMLGDNSHEIRVLAACQALSRGSFIAAVDHFRLVFRDTVADVPTTAKIGQPSDRAASDTSDNNTSTKATSKCTPTWDIFLLHEDEYESIEKAENLLFFLRSVYGLRVQSRDSAIPHGASEFQLEGNIKDSHITVVLAETEDHNDNMLTHLIRLASLSSSTVTLLAEEQARVPVPLAGLRSMRCPDALFKYRRPPAVDEGNAKVIDDKPSGLSNEARDAMKGIDNVNQVHDAMRGIRPPDNVDEGATRDDKSSHPFDDVQGAMGGDRPPQTADEGHGRGAGGGAKPPNSNDETSIEETGDICPTFDEPVIEALGQLARFLCKIDCKAANETH